MADEIAQLRKRAKIDGLAISAVAPLTTEDGFDKAYRSVALLSPDPQHFWEIFSTSEEANDGRPDPIDRWSRNRISRIAEEFGGMAAFPFEGPPYHPFSSWAQRASVAWPSPAGLLVHSDYGLWISFRGAVVLTSEVEAPSTTKSPCDPCPRPCLSACPVSAFRDGGFDYPACLAHVRSDAGADCALTGCLARRACPVGQAFAPPPAQLQLHMKAFAGA